MTGKGSFRHALHFLQPQEQEKIRDNWLNECQQHLQRQPIDKGTYNKKLSKHCNSYILLPVLYIIVCHRLYYINC